MQVYGNPTHGKVRHMNKIETSSNEDQLRFNTADEIIKIIILIIGWYIALFHGVLTQVMEAEPIVRTVIGILLMTAMVNSIPNRNLKKETSLQNLVFWLEAAIIFLTVIFGLSMIQASMEDMGYTTGDYP